MKNDTHIDRLVIVLDEFNEAFPRHGFRVLISEKYDIGRDWKKTWPSNEKPGVYVLIDESLYVQYIGKASNNIGARLNSHKTSGLLNKDIDKNPLHIRYIWTIAVPDESFFEASAIEEYLIRRLNPPLNRIGKEIAESFR